MQPIDQIVSLECDRLQCNVAYELQYSQDLINLTCPQVTLASHSVQRYETTSFRCTPSFVRYTTRMHRHQPWITVGLMSLLSGLLYSRLGKCWEQCVSWMIRTRKGRDQVADISMINRPSTTSSPYLWKIILRQTVGQWNLLTDIFRQ